MISPNLINESQARWLLPQLVKHYQYMTETAQRAKHKYTKNIASTIIKLKANEALISYTALEKLMIISCINENKNDSNNPELAKVLLKKFGWTRA